jgi:D-hexose-6-phosphate mutarotase
MILSGISLPPCVRRDSGRGGLPCLRVDHATFGSAEVYLHGAHLARWQPPGHDPVLWVSSRSLFEAGKPIRGGVPICFPWFGPHPTDKQAPLHGFARTQPWTLASAGESADGATLAFSLADSEANRGSAWPHPFAAEYRVTAGTSLTLTLDVRNTGALPVTFEAALHTYFAVGDVRQVRITGLEETEYLDKTAAFARRSQGHEPVRITGETDRVYLATRAACTLEDPVMRRRIRIAKDGSDTTVVWNPWVDKARAMPDFGDEEWPVMVCIETCNAGEAAVRLDPGQRHAMTAVIEVERT